MKPTSLRSGWLSRNGPYSLSLEQDYRITCPSDGKILEYYEGHFESVYVALHPFVKPSSGQRKHEGELENLRLNNKDPDYTIPTTAEVFFPVAGEQAKLISWKEVISKTNLRNIKNLDIGLKTRISALKPEFQSESFASEIRNYLEQEDVIAPEEGNIPTSLARRIVTSLGYPRADSLWVSSEFGDELRLEGVGCLEDGIPIPWHGSIFSEDRSFLLTAHWDSFFTLICAGKGWIEQLLSACPLEGFYCSEETEVFWSTRNEVPVLYGSIK